MDRKMIDYLYLSARFVIIMSPCVPSQLYVHINFEWIL